MALRAAVFPIGHFAVFGKVILGVMFVVFVVLQAYCINKDQFDYIRDVTHFSKTKAPWNVDPYEEKGAIDSKVKSTFTRTFNKQVSL